MNIPDPLQQTTNKNVCGCSGCIGFNAQETSDHLNNMYSRLAEQTKLIDDQQQTLTLILKELIPLVKNFTEKQNQTISILTKIESYK